MFEIKNETINLQHIAALVRDGLYSYFRHRGIQPNLLPPPTEYKWCIDVAIGYILLHCGRFTLSWSGGQSNDPDSFYYITLSRYLIKLGVNIEYTEYNSEYGTYFTIFESIDGYLTDYLIRRGVNDVYGLDNYLFQKGHWFIVYTGDQLFFEFVDMNLDKPNQFLT